MEGIEAMVDRADYPPSAFLDVKQADGTWQTWFVSATISCAFGMCTLHDIFYTYSTEDERNVAMGSFKTTRDETHHIPLETLTAPLLPASMVPVYTLCVVLGDDDLTSENMLE